MACCALGCATHFSSKIANRDLRRYHRKGADAVTRLMLSELRQWYLWDRDLLDIGAGIGVIAAEMARSGVVRATVVEASPAYLDVAREEVGQLYKEGFTRFVMGDFAAIAEDVADADVVTLGRVVCCYPDAATLLREAAVRTRRILAFTYPRNRWYVRAVNVLQNFWRKVRGSTFQTFVHVPNQMERTLEDAGLVRVAQKGTAVWMLDVYEREVD
jgi:2-polyprenyl-3-methyl-5-hydroxy-6-metoxy-1,4-benzoquinol methylase